MNAQGGSGGAKGATSHEVPKESGSWERPASWKVTTGTHASSRELERGPSPRLPERRSLVHGSARVHLWSGARRNVVRMEGVIREENVGDWLAPLIDEMHHTAIASRMDEVTLDIRRLEYANAALWRCLVQWLKRIREDTGGYDLRIVSDPNRAWQQLGVPALRVFSLDSEGAERLMLDMEEP